MAAGDPAPEIRGQRREFRETIGGRAATLYENEFDGRYHTGATWSAPAVYLQGEGSDATTARVQLAVYRTVRFTAS